MMGVTQSDLEYIAADFRAMGFFSVSSVVCRQKLGAAHAGRRVFIVFWDVLPDVAEDLDTSLSAINRISLLF